MKSDLTKAVPSPVAAATFALAVSLTASLLGTGEAAAQRGVPENLKCQGGKGMVAQVELGKNGAAILQFAPIAGVVSGPVQCAWASGRPFDFQMPVTPLNPPADFNQLILPLGLDKALGAVAAARTGSFTVLVVPQNLGTPMLVAKVIDIQLALNGEPADTPMGDTPPMDPGAGTVDSDDCPAGAATVSTPPGLDFLNVRDKPSKTAKVLSQLQNGSEVSVTGACLQPAAGFAKKTLKPVGGDAPAGMPADGSAWCRIDAPKQGCVAAEFLTFDDAGPLKPAAGFAKKH